MNKPEYASHSLLKHDQSQLTVSSYLFFYYKNETDQLENATTLATQFSLPLVGQLTKLDQVYKYNYNVLQQGYYLSSRD